MQRRIAVALLLTLVAVFGFGCGHQATGNVVLDGVDKQQDPITLGAIFVMSGLGADYGQNGLKGATIALEEINAKGGVLGRELELDLEDNIGPDARRAVGLYKKFVDSGIDIIIGPQWSAPAIAVAPQACEDGVLAISPTAGLETFNEMCDYLFNLWPHDKELSRDMGKYVVSQGLTNLAVLGSLEVWEKTQAEHVRDAVIEAGGNIVSYQLVAVDESNFGTEVTKIIESGADAVVFANYGSAPLAAKRIREINDDIKFFSIMVDGPKIEAAAGAFEGTIVASNFQPRDWFHNKMRARYGHEARIGSDATYDTVKLIARAMEETGSTDPGELARYLNTLETYDGASGYLTFDDLGGVARGLHYEVIRDGKLVPLE